MTNYCEFCGVSVTLAEDGIWEEPNQNSYCEKAPKWLPNSFSWAPGMADHWHKGIEKPQKFIKLYEKLL